MALKLQVALHAALFNVAEAGPKPSCKTQKGQKKYRQLISVYIYHHHLNLGFFSAVCRETRCGFKLKQLWKRYISDATQEQRGT